MHPPVRTVRVETCRALMLNVRRVEAIGDTWIRFGNQTDRRDPPGRPVGVPLWEFGRSTAELSTSMGQSCAGHARAFG